MPKSTFDPKNDPFSEREAQKYENPIPSREFILQYLAETGQPATREQMEQEFDLQTETQQEALRRRLIAMTRDGQLLRNRRNAYGPVESMELVPGRVIGHKDGFGFVERESGGDDLFLSPGQMRTVFHGDRVLARVAGVDARGRREAVIVEVIERNTHLIVGRFHGEAGNAWVESANRRITQDIFIPPDARMGASEGQVVLVEITDQPGRHTRPLGKVIEVLGDHMAPGMEINVAVYNHSLPVEWPEAVLTEAARFPATVSEADVAGDGASPRRKDLRHLSFVTIDGEDAKDFDDAVYCERHEKNGWTLYVAIADVSHYVRPDTALDREAWQRGNSVYFPGRVIPMLPESLSNHLCSLMPNVDRLAMVCEMTISAEGAITDYRFDAAVFRSKARLTYDQVHLMAEKKEANVRKQFAAHVPHVEELYALFHVLKKAREVRGAIDFDLPETRIVFGRDRKIEKIVPYERFDSHRVIEECMLSANICAARFLEQHKQPGLYRVHEGPTAEKLENLKKFLNEVGLSMPAHREPVAADYAHILRAIRGRPDAHMIQTILLRSMSQAIYSPHNRGHFGLAYEAYAHFTSPIRRYPDLLVHRGIKQILLHKTPLVDEAALMRAGEHCSMTERRADDATHEVTDWLKCEFMMDRVGETFAGIVSGVTSFGIFVELQGIYVEGLVHISALPGDYWQFDPVAHTLTGTRTGRRYRIGDPVEIRVARVNLDRGEIDFVLAEDPLPLKTKSGRTGDQTRREKGKKRLRSTKDRVNEGEAQKKQGTETKHGRRRKRSGGRASKKSGRQDGPQRRSEG